ncbi:MAG: FAD-binding protein [Variibacter sp.]|nr:FAD-binding protein [Variibacter sp.]
MSKVLVIAEHAAGKLNAATAKCVSCAGQIPGAEVTVAVLASGGAGVAAQAAALAGVAKVLCVEHAGNGRALAAIQAPQVAALAKGYTHVLAPSTTYGKDLLPRVAALLGVGQVSDLQAVLGAKTFQRPTYAGNAIVTVEVAASPVVATVRIASFQAAGAGGPAPIETVSLDVELPGHTRFVELKAAASDRPDLQSAAKVVSGGRALGSAENFQLLYGLADQLGAAVGASRAAVDAGYAPSDLQVGQTGKIIAPEVYFAFGISGAIQHLTGIKDARTIVAVNKDPEAPIFEVADLGLVADLFAVIPELRKALGG